MQYLNNDDYLGSNRLLGLPVLHREVLYFAAVYYFYRIHLPAKMAEQTHGGGIP